MIPEPLRNDWAARQICLSYDLSVVGNRWIDLFLSAGLSPHRVHHVLPYQGSGFANLASEATRQGGVRAGRHRLGAPAEPDLRPLPGRHQALLLCPVKPAPPRPSCRLPRPMDEMPPPPPVVRCRRRADGWSRRRPPRAGCRLDRRPRSARRPPMGTPAPSPVPPRLSVRGQLGEFVRYTAGGFQGVGV